MVIFNGSVRLTDSGTQNEYFKQLDSLFRFYGSQITAHANYLVAWVFAFVVSLYRLIDRIENPPLLWYDKTLIFLFIVFIVFGIWLYGRLHYYSELVMIVERCMGIVRFNENRWIKWQELLKKEQKQGVANIVSRILYNRLRYRLSREVEDENLKEIIEFEPFFIKLWKAYLIIFGCIRQKRYRKFIN